MSSLACSNFIFSIIGMECQARTISQIIDNLLEARCQAEVSYNQLKRLLAVHGSSECTKGCLDNLPSSNSLVTAITDLDSVIQELTCKVVTGLSPLVVPGSLLLQALGRVRQAHRLLAEFRRLRRSYLSNKRSNSCRSLLFVAAQT